MPTPQSPTWPVLQTYENDHADAIALPLGGIGTGTVSLGGRGQLCDWEVMNRPNKGLLPGRGGGTQGQAVALLRTYDAAGTVRLRCLEGSLRPPFLGGFGASDQLAGLPRCRASSFHAAYPLAQVTLADPDLPLSVRLEAFNPLLPCNAPASSLPVAVLRYVLINDGDTPVAATVCVTMENFIGNDGLEGRAIGNRCDRREGALRGVAMRSEGVPVHDERWGTMALATPDTGEVTIRSACADLSWADQLADLWDDLASDGRIEERAQGGRDVPRCAVAVAVEVPAHGSRAVTFLLTWHFPNRQTWTAQRQEAGRPWSDFPENRIGNWYCTRHTDAWAVAVDVVSRLPELEAATVRFVRAVVEADLPLPVRDAALSNLSTLRSQTVFRTPDGLLFGWEGVGDRVGSCHGSCTHVWNYEHATAALFGELARSMREVEFVHCTGADGHQAFRCNLPLDHARDWRTAAADGQLGSILKLHREWRCCGDDAWLAQLWPAARRALEFCWIPGGWDADRDGVMEGCQHNTLDVEYYGPNALMQFWYLGALRAAAAMANALGQADFANHCRDLAQQGAAWTDANLFNGSWYVQHIRPSNATEIAPGLREGHMGAADPREPDFQLGDACLVDQLAGQVFAGLEGLGDLADPRHIACAARAVWQHNHRAALGGHVNHMRAFALGDEPALLMATWPAGGRPRRPVPYADEAMTGFEYTAALALILTGAEAEGVQAIADVRSRHDGRRRNPFDEPECGHHYARAMASWGAINALTGLHWSARSGELTLHRSPHASQGVWAVGVAWGTWNQNPVANGSEVAIAIHGGTLSLRAIVLDGVRTEIGTGGGTVIVPWAR